MKQNNSVVFFLSAMLAVISFSDALADTGCVVIAEVSADVFVAGQRMHLEPRVPTRLQKCGDLRAESGFVTACFLQQDGRRTCARIGSGKSMPDAAIAQEGKSVAEAFRATLIAFAKGDSQTRVGQTRGNVKLPGLPHGEILIFGESLEIDLAGTGLSDIQSLKIEGLDLESSSALIGEMKDGKARFSAKELLPGVKYRWRLKTAKREYTYSFNVASRESVERLRLKTDETALQSDSDLGRAILLAELYLQNGYAFNARVELAKQGLVVY